MAYNTTMSALLTNIKTVFLANKVAIGTDYFKKGILPPLPCFPCVAILPMSESIVEYRNSGNYVIQRDINIEVYGKNYDAKVANEQVKDIITNIIAVSQTQNRYNANKWSSSAFDCTWAEEKYEEPFQYKNQIMQVGILPMTFISNESLPANIPNYATVTETNLSDIIDQIYTKLVAYRDKTDVTYDLSSVKSIYKKEVPPIPDFPSITVNSGSTKRERNYTGEDAPNFSIEIAVWTKLLDKEYTLDKNLTIVEIVKDIVQYNTQWTGKAVSTTINSINYERAEVNNIGFVYKTGFDLIVEGLERY